MSFIKNYKLLQAALLSIAIAGFGIAAYNTVNANASANADQSEVVMAEVVEQPLSDGAIILSEDDGYPAPIDDEEDEDFPEVDEDEEGEDGLDEDGDFDDEDSDEDSGELDDEDGSEELDDEDDDDDSSEDSDEDTEELDGEDDDQVYNDVLELIGVDEETLEEALSNGQSLADVAEDNGVDAQTIVDLFIAAEEKAIAEELAAGEISEEEAAEIRQEISRFVAFEISNPYPDPAKVVVETLGVDADTFWEALDSGQSLDQIADSAGTDMQTVIDAVVQAETEYIDAMVAAGVIDAEERDEWVADIKAEVTEFLSEEFGGDGEGQDDDAEEDEEEED